MPAKPDALLGDSDIVAIGAISMPREAGLNILDDIAFIGFDDLLIATLLDAQLTTARQPVTQFGAKAVEILIDLVENSISPPHHIIRETEFVIRESCGVFRE